MWERFGPAESPRLESLSSRGSHGLELELLDPAGSPRLVSLSPRGSRGFEGGIGCPTESPRLEPLSSRGPCWVGWGERLSFLKNELVLQKQFVLDWAHVEKLKRRDHSLASNTFWLNADMNDCSRCEWSGPGAMHDFS